MGRSENGVFRIRRWQAIDIKKQMDLIRKRNSELTNKLDELKLQMELDAEVNAQDYQCAKDLIRDLEKIKTEWISALNGLYEQQAQYSYLLSDLNDLHDTLLNKKTRHTKRNKIFAKFFKKNK